MLFGLFSRRQFRRKANSNNLRPQDEHRIKTKNLVCWDLVPDGQDSYIWKGMDAMNEREITEALEKQLQLLSERSEKSNCLSTEELVSLTRAMNETAGYLLSRLSRVL